MVKKIIKKIVKRKVVRPAEEGVSVPKTAEAAPPRQLLDPEIQEILSRMHDMNRDIRDKLSKIYELTGYDFQQIKSFAENPKNFSRKQWEEITQNREVIEAKLLAFLGPRVKAEKAKMVTDRLSKARKAKMVGARRKHWIPIR